MAFFTLFLGKMAPTRLISGLENFELALRTLVENQLSSVCEGTISGENY